MKIEDKIKAMNKTTCDLNAAKDRMYSAVCTLESYGLIKDADQLMRMIFRLESFQNKY